MSTSTGLSISGDGRRKADWIELIHGKSGSSPAGAVADPGHGLYSTASYDSGGGSDPGVTSLAGDDVLWTRVESDGSTVEVWFLKKTEAAGTPGEGDWSAIAGSPCINTASSFSFSGGRLGFAADGSNYGISADDVTIKSWEGSAWKPETVETFTTDGSGYTSDTLAYDNNGNLTYDGTQGYTYDAWNRQITVAHAYNDGSVHSGQTAVTCGYDASGRRITKAVANTGGWDATYHYYYSAGYQIIEEQNGSGQSIKDHVWGLTYVDEILQTRINTTPTGTATWSDCYPLQDANFNVQGVTDSSGALVERYEYGAYGRRQVFTSAGTNDPGLYASADASVKVITSGGVTQPYGLNEIGHQDLQHDEQTNLVYNRARYLHPVLGRFCQNDPLGYVDGVNLSLLESNNPTLQLDPQGLAKLIFIFEGLNGFNLDAFRKWSDVSVSVAQRDISKAHDATVLKALASHGYVAKGPITPDELKKDKTQTVLFYFGEQDIELAQQYIEKYKITEKIDKCGEYHTIAVIGHSFGGDAAWMFATKLKDKGVDVDLGYTFDPRPNGGWRTGENENDVSWHNWHYLNPGKWVNYYRPAPAILHGYELPPQTPNLTNAKLSIWDDHFRIVAAKIGEFITDIDALKPTRPKLTH